MSRQKDDPYAVIEIHKKTRKDLENYDKDKLLELIMIYDTKLQTVKSKEKKDKWTTALADLLFFLSAGLTGYSATLLPPNFNSVLGWIFLGFAALLYIIAVVLTIVLGR